LPVRAEVLDTFVRVARDTPGNPSSMHRAGRHAHAVLEGARDEVAHLLRTSPRNILFTSGATEANNLAVFGLARAAQRMDGKPLCLIASRAEHASALAPLRILQQGMVSLQRQNEASLVVLQWANNETGVVQEVDAVAAGIDDRSLWHCDAVQGFGKLPLRETLWRATTMALSGHKFGAPRGVGVLRLSDTALLDPLQVGGGQQRSLRSGTEAPALAASFAHALRLGLEEQTSFAAAARESARVFLEELRRAEIPFENNHSSDQESLPNTLNLMFPNLDGRLLLPACDADGLEVSAGAACSAGAAMPSSVLLAAGLSQEQARSSLRISFGPDFDANAAAEASRVLGKLLRRMYEVAKR
jgi:cysteine desulfurase